MTDNVQLKDGLGDAFWARTKDVGASSDPVHISASTPFDQYGVPLFTETNPGAVAEAVNVISASFNRPANTTAYVIGKLVANSVTAGAVVPLNLAVARENGGSAIVRRGRLSKSGPSLSNAIFRAHLYEQIPVPANGDGAAWLTTGSLFYSGSLTFDFTGLTARVFSDGASIIAAPDVGVDQLHKILPGTQSIFALIEARGAYTPASGETFTLALEVRQN